MESKEAHLVLSQLRRAKEEVSRLEAEYRKICECNEKLSEVKPESESQKWSYQKMYKTCKYHEVRFYRHTGEPRHASV
jgi:hypothetical protein